MFQVPLVHRYVGAALALALLAGTGESRALAGGHFYKHGHGVATTNVAFVPVSTGFHAVSAATPSTMTMVAAPAQFHFVNSTQLQMAAPAVQAFTPNVSMIMMAVPQGQYLTTGVMASTGVQGTLMTQQDLVQQFQALGWLEKLRGALRDKLSQKNRDFALTGILPTKDQLVKFLLDEAFSFLKDTPYGPLFAFLKPVIEPLIDNLLKEQPPGAVPSGPTNGTTGAVRRYIITVQEISSDGTPIPNTGPAPVTPTMPPRIITNDPQSLLETFAPFPGR